MRLPGSLRVQNEGLAFLPKVAVIVPLPLNTVLPTMDLRLAAE